MRAGSWWLWIVPPLLFAGVIWISSDIRYRAPIEPFVLLTAAVAVTGIRRVRRQPPTPALPR
jgi:hypothetical protein